jgi:hypothetical protein
MDGCRVRGVGGALISAENAGATSRRFHCGGIRSWPVYTAAVMCRISGLLISSARASWVAR